MICLYNLLFTYFERSERTQSKKQIEEILLIKDFNIVFEDMIDDLIGDSTLFSELKITLTENRLTIFTNINHF